MTQTQRSETALAIIDPRRVPLAIEVFGEDRLSLLAEQVGRGWKVPPTEAEIEIIALLCHENRWNIFAKPPQVHFVKRWDSNLGKEVMTPQPSIDGMRLAASRNRNYIGPAGWAWCGDDGIWQDVWLSPDPPRAARAGVLVRGRREPLYAVALWDEWAQWQDEYAYDKGQNKRVKTGSKVLAPFWQSKPAHMLAKTAECMILKQTCPAETDKFELAHLEEMDRLEAPARAAEYARLYGADEDHAFAELPMGAGAPTYTPPSARTDLVDAPRGALAATVLEPVGAERVSAAAPSARKRDRGNLIEEYGVLLTQAVQSGAVPDASAWVLRANLPDVGIVDKGRQLRALLNAHTVAQRTNAPAPTQDDADDDDQGLSEGEQMLADGPPAAATKTAMVGVRSDFYAKMSDLIEDAARLDVEFDDLKVADWPAPREEVIRKTEQLQDRVDAKKQRLAEPRTSEQQQEAQLL